MPTLSASTDLLRLMGDPNRVRLLALLEREEMTVAELTQVTRLAQSRVSTHLGKLRKAGLVTDRRSGSSAYYRLNRTRMPDDAAEIWSLILAGTSDPLLEQDAKRAREVLRARGQASWADSVAGRMERHYSPGRTWQSLLRGFLGLMRLGDVLDVASGDCAVAELIAGRAKRVACLDISATVLRAGRRRLDGLDRVSFHRGDMQALPFQKERFDQVLLLNCLTYAEDPKRVVEEAARVLKPDGALVAVTLASHGHEERVASYGHIRMCFAPTDLRAMFLAAGLAVDLCAVTSRERSSPHFEVISAHARKEAA